MRSTPNNEVNQRITSISAGSGQQLRMQLRPVKEVEIDGIQMGVLSDGTPYLTLRGLARICGVDPANVQRIVSNWDEERTKPRGKRILELLRAQGHNGENIDIRTSGVNGETVAYSDSVCMAILEYYAFEAQQSDNRVALQNFRILARSSFRAYIYNRCGYDPSQRIPDAWQNFHDRVTKNDNIPIGYFSVFRELADIVIHLITSGLEYDSNVVPDISVGKVWSNYWSDNGFDSVYGQRTKFPHIYPDWYPQAVANPVESWIYPASALGEFRVWLYREYVQKNFPAYLEKKVRDGRFLPSKVELLLEAVNRPELGQ